MDECASALRCPGSPAESQVRSGCFGDKRDGRRTSRQDERRHRAGLPNNDRVHRAMDELHLRAHVSSALLDAPDVREAHGIVDRHSSRHASAWRVDVERDGRRGFGFEEEELGDDDGREGVFDLSACEGMLVPFEGSREGKKEDGRVR